MKRLTVDYNFAADKNVKGGVTQENIEMLRQKARSAYAKLTDMVKSGEVGFPNLPNQNTESIKKMAKDLAKKYNELVIIGIGGSSLGFEAITNALLPYNYNSGSFSDRKSFPRYWLLDNADPSLANAVIKNCNKEDTFVIVISKSGSTLETNINFAVIYEWLTSDSIDIKKHMAFITDATSGALRKFAKEKELITFEIPENVGGRYSVLSPVGLFPAALLGLDIDKMLDGAKSIMDKGWENILTVAAIYIHFIDNKISINSIMPYSSRLTKFAEWFCQLWGESLGKKYNNSREEVYCGTTPVRLTGAIDQHSQLQLMCEGPNDKFITFIGVDSHFGDRPVKNPDGYGANYLSGQNMGSVLNMELVATEAALLEQGRPSMRINIAQLDEFSLGQLFMSFQYLVAIIGMAYDINPFDQPGVEAGKDYVYGLIGRKGYDDKKTKLDGIYIKSDEFII